MTANTLRIMLVFACVALLSVNVSGEGADAIEASRALIVVDGDMSEWGGIAAAAKDASGDAFSEAADLELVKLAADEQHLYVLIEADAVPGHTGKTDKWHHAERSLYVEIEGSRGDAVTVQLRGTSKGWC